MMHIGTLRERCGTHYLTYETDIYHIMKVSPSLRTRG